MVADRLDRNQIKTCWVSQQTFACTNPKTGQRGKDSNFVFFEICQSKLRYWRNYIDTGPSVQVVFTTERGQRHQQAALDAAPDNLDIANLLPYFPQTNLMINADYFAKMKEGSYLVSCGSGSVINEADLAEAIKSGKLTGAALDTFEWEPIKAGNPLIALANAGHNVLLTPHIAAGGMAAARERLKDYTNITNHINGQPLKYRTV